MTGFDLLPDVKNYLDVTWEDEAGDRKIARLIEAGVSYLCRKAGSDIDISGDRDAYMLLVDYVRYARSNALDLFEQAYIHEICALREKYETKNGTDSV
jgi:hypothetical protein